MGRRNASVQVAVIVACGTILTAAVTAVGAIACAAIQKRERASTGFSRAGPPASAAPC